MTPKVSTVAVVIPTHDRPEWTCRAIQSVAVQTRPADEIIVVDDGSHDGTGLCAKRAFPQIKLHTLPSRRGVSAARNVGIRLAKSEWIALLDSDDEWLPRKLEMQCQALADEPGMRFCHTEEIWIRDGVRVNAMRKHQKYGGHIYEKCLPLCAISPSSVLIHRSVFHEVGPFDEDLVVCEDYDYWLRFCARHPVQLVKEPLLVKYGGHDDQLSRAHWGMDRFRVVALKKILASGVLVEQDWEQTRAMLCAKLDILRQGASKRATATATDWQTQLEHWQEATSGASAHHG